MAILTEKFLGRYGDIHIRMEGRLLWQFLLRSFSADMVTSTLGWRGDNYGNTY